MTEKVRRDADFWLLCRMAYRLCPMCYHLSRLGEGARDGMKRIQSILLTGTGMSSGPWTGRQSMPPKRNCGGSAPLFGMVFQHYNLFPHLTFLRNITEAPVHVRRKKKEEAEARARELLTMMGLSGQEDKYPSQLSGVSSGWPTPGRSPWIRRSFSLMSRPRRWTRS